jgi:hypothetical protein
MSCSLASKSLAYNLNSKKLSRANPTHESPLSFGLDCNLGAVNPTLFPMRRYHSPPPSLLFDEDSLLGKCLRVNHGGAGRENEQNGSTHNLNRNMFMRKGLYKMMDTLLSIQRVRGGPE